jgi:hypothetical protein
MEEYGEVKNIASPLLIARAANSPLTEFEARQTKSVVQKASSSFTAHNGNQFPSVSIFTQSLIE